MNIQLIHGIKTPGVSLITILPDISLGKKLLPEKSCLITFDDGLKSQYENALPLLEKLKVPAIFFVNALPYAEERACLIHKVHYSRANLPPKVFRDKILNFIDREIQFPSFRELKKKY